MIKVIIFAVIGLVVGLGGGSGFSVMKAKKAAAAAHDSTAKGDSTLAEHKSSGEGHETPKAGEGKEHASSTDVSSADSAAVTSHVAEPKHEAAAAPAAGGHEPAPNAVKPVVAPPSAATVAKAPAADSSKASTPGRIAKIFAAMSAKDAARVLEKLDDSDVQTVLSGLNDKQAAAILSGFPAERAAAISRAAIRGKKGA